MTLTHIKEKENIEIEFDFKDNFLRPVEIYRLAQKNNLEKAKCFFETVAGRYPVCERNVSYYDNSISFYGIEFDISKTISIEEFFELCLKNNSENKILETYSKSLTDLKIEYDEFIFMI